jgi:replicative DNA helicase
LKALRAPKLEAKGLPDHLAGEGSLLRAVLEAPDRLSQVRSTVRPEDFSDLTLRTVYEAACRIVEAGGSPDHLSLLAALPSGAGPGEQGSWTSLVSRLMAYDGSGAYIGHRSRVVREQSALRELIQACSSAKQQAIDASAGDETNGAAPVFADLQDALFRISETGISARVMSLAEAIQRHFDESNVGERRIPLGFSEFDRLMRGGPASGEVLVIAARPGVGKSTMLLQIARNAAGSGKRILFFSLEMRSEQLAARFLSNLAQVDRNRINRAAVDSQEADKLRQAVEIASGLAITFVEDPSLTTGGISSRVRAEKMRGGVDLVLIDYLQLITSPGSEDRLQEVSQVSRGLKRLAIEAQVPIIVAAQLSRAAEQQEHPGLHHLRESGTIEQDADEVLLLSVPRDGPDNEVYADLAKNRDGGTGHDTLTINKRYAWIGDRTMNDDQYVWRS